MGSVRGMTDASGTPQATITYDGFGNVLSDSNSSFTDRYLYTGRELDSVTGLQYNRARIMIPRWGDGRRRIRWGSLKETKTSIDTPVIVPLIFVTQMVWTRLTN